jgi:predicted nucleic acid-binding protein
MIADSSAWVEYLRATGSPQHMRLKQAISRRQRVFMLDVIYQEVLQGAGSVGQYIQLQTRLDNVSSWEPEDSREIASQAAMLYARCRWQGFTIRSPNDCLIAVSAIEAGEPLLHADRDFERIAEIEPRLRFA